MTSLPSTQKRTPPDDDRAGRGKAARTRKGGVQQALTGLPAGDWMRASELNRILPAYEASVQPLHLLALNSCGLLFLGLDMLENIGARSLKEFKPRFRDTDLAPLGHGGRFDVAQPGNCRGAAESVDDFRWGFGLHVQIIG